MKAAPCISQQRQQQQQQQHCTWQVDRSQYNRFELSRGLDKRGHWPRLSIDDQDDEVVSTTQLSVSLHAV